MFNYTHFSLIPFNHKKEFKTSTVANPEIKETTSTMQFTGLPEASITTRTITGGTIIREIDKPAWKIVLNHSWRENGKVRKKQAYIRTAYYWDIVDDFLYRLDRWGKERIEAGYCLSGDGYDFDNRIRKVFPNADLDKIWKLFQEKAEQIEEAVFKEFKASDEFKWWKLNQKLRKEIDRLKKAEEKAKQRQEQQANYKQQFKQQTYQDTFREYEEARKAFISTSSPAVTLSQAEATLIEKCYKAMAVQVHPDKGGSVEDMQILNSLRDRVRKCVGET
jgi:hypothetical protein